MYVLAWAVASHTRFPDLKIGLAIQLRKAKVTKNVKLHGWWRVREGVGDSKDCTWHQLSTHFKRFLQDLPLIWTPVVYTRMLYKPGRLAHAR